MSDTPKTDEVNSFIEKLNTMDAIEYAIYHAQKLERELTEANERIKQLNAIVAMHELMRTLRIKMTENADTPQSVIEILNTNFQDLV